MFKITLIVVLLIHVLSLHLFQFDVNILFYFESNIFFFFDI